MTPDSPVSPDRNRRDFVKKSLAASIIAAQPTILAGLVRAQGGRAEAMVPETTVPWETTVGDTTAEATTAADFTNWDTTELEATGLETTVVETTAPKYEYALKCVEAPDAVNTNPSGWCLTDWFDAGYWAGAEGTIESHNDDLNLIMAAKGPFKDTIDTSFTVAVAVQVERGNLGDGMVTSTAISSCTVKLADPRSPVVTITPPIQPLAKSSGSADVVAFAVVYPAFLAAGFGVYHDNGTNGLSGSVAMGPLTLDYEKGGDDDVTPVKTQAWSVVLVSRPWGSTDDKDFIPVKPQPSNLTPNPEGGNLPDE